MVRLPGRGCSLLALLFLIPALTLSQTRSPDMSDDAIRLRSDLVVPGLQVLDKKTGRSPGGMGRFGISD